MASFWVGGTVGGGGTVVVGMGGTVVIVSTGSGIVVVGAGSGSGLGDGAGAGPHAPSRRAKPTTRTVRRVFRAVLSVRIVSHLCAQVGSHPIILRPGNDQVTSM